MKRVAEECNNNPPPRDTTLNETSSRARSNPATRDLTPVIFESRARSFPFIAPLPFLYTVNCVGSKEG